MDVLATTRGVLENAASVRLNDTAIEQWAAAWQPMSAAEHASPFDDVLGTRDEIANLVLLADALNFCFWSDEPISTQWRGRRVERYMAFAAALARAVSDDRRWVDAGFWVEMSPAWFESALRVNGHLLMVSERVAVI